MNQNAAASIADEELVSLLNLGRGAAIERFDDELRRVFANILDVNTTDAPRSISLVVTVKPNKERSRADVVVKCTSKVAPAEPFDTQIFLGADGRGPIAVEHNPEQMRLSFLSAPAQLREVV